jgi:hypothetical protein
LGPLSLLIVVVEIERFAAECVPPGNVLLSSLTYPFAKNLTLCIAYDRTRDARNLATMEQLTLLSKAAVRSNSVYSLHVEDHQSFFRRPCKPDYDGCSVWEPWLKSESSEDKHVHHVLLFRARVQRLRHDQVGVVNQSFSVKKIHLHEIQVGPGGGGSCFSLFSRFCVD